MRILNSKTKLLRNTKNANERFVTSSSRASCFAILLRQRFDANAHRLQKYTHGCVAQSFVDRIRQFILQVPQSERCMDECHTEWQQHNQTNEQHRLEQIQHEERDRADGNQIEPSRWASELLMLRLSLHLAWIDDNECCTNHTDGCQSQNRLPWIEQYEQHREQNSHGEVIRLIVEEILCHTIAPSIEIVEIWCLKASRSKQKIVERPKRW